MIYRKIILYTTICLVAGLGDFVVFQSKYSEFQLFKALADNCVHATIGFLSCLLFLSHGFNISIRDYIFNIILCTSLSSLIDIDHFILAKSIKLKDLTTLRQRGFLHCTTLWIAITGFMLIYSNIMKKLNIYLISFVIMIAFLSHHIRDGNRRGLWMYPFGHTPPINKFLYIWSTATLPVLLYYVYVYFKPSVKFNTSYEYV